jgi:hypothetical protein
MKDLKKIQEFFSKSLEEAELKLGVKYELPNGDTGYIMTQSSDDPKEWIFSDGFKKVPYLSVKDKLKPLATQPGKYDGAFDLGLGKGHYIDEGNKEYFKSSIRKDKSNPNFLYVDIAYPAGSGVLSIGGDKTMSGQDREAGAAKALVMGNAIVKKLEAKYNIEDIEVKDLKNGKVQVFAVSDDFIKMASPSLDEAKEETAVDMAKKQLDALGVKYELGNKFKPFKVIYKPTGQSDKFYDTFEDIVDLFNLKGVVKSSMGEAKFMSGMLSAKDFINAKLNKYPKAKAKVNQLIDMIGESKFTIEMAEWLFDFFNNASYESPMNEAKEEDKVDTITMDIPLFIRMLEYSREDAAQDVDLHDVTEKAISLGKERGILQMDDYAEIVGAAEEIQEIEDDKFKNDPWKGGPEYKKEDLLAQKIFGIKYFGWLDSWEQSHLVNKYNLDKNIITKEGKEVNLKQSKLSSAEYQKTKKLKDFKASDWKWNTDEDLYVKVVEEGMGGQLDEPFFIEVSVRDARKALDLFQDRYRNSNIDMYGSNVYAADTPEDIYDLYYDLMSQDIEVLDYNVEDEDFDYDSEYEDTLMEANVPSNIKDFAKRKGISSLVNKVAGWAEKVGARIAGGTAIGKNYGTLILDLDYKQQGEIRINIDEETIELYDEPVNSFNDFQRVYVDGADNNLEEAKNTSLDSKTIQQIKDDIKGFPKYQKRGFESFKKEVRERYKITPKQLEDILHGELTESKEESLSLAEKIVNKIKEDRPGLWANIHAQRERGEKPARKGSKDYKSAVAAGKRINKEK